MNVLDSNLKLKRRKQLVAGPTSPNEYIRFILLPPTDLDGDGRPELVVLHSRVEFVSPTDVSNASLLNQRRYRNTTLTIYDLTLRQRAALIIQTDGSQGIDAVLHASKSPAHKNQIVVLGRKVGCYEFAR